MSEPRPRRRYLVGGIVLVTVALWLLMEAAGVPLPSLRRLWPIFIILGGLASVADYFAGTRKPTSLGRGVGAIGLGILFLLLTHDIVRWSDGVTGLSAISLIIGLSLLATWAGGGRTQPRLIGGLMFSGLGLAGLVGRLDLLKRLLPSPLVTWGLLLLIIGIFLIWQNIKKQPD